LGDVNLTNSGTGNASEISIASNALSTAIIEGNTSAINNGNAITTNRFFLGNQGDITFNGTLNLVNNAGTNNSEIFCNFNSNSVNFYNDNITVSSTNVNSDGIFFGSSNGTGTLAATKTISIPGVDITNYIGGQLLFRNFTQIGSTPQSLELGPTANLISNRDCNWGGNVDFRGPRHNTRETIYNQVILLLHGTVLDIPLLETLPSPILELELLTVE